MTQYQGNNPAPYPGPIPPPLPMRAYPMNYVAPMHQPRRGTPLLWVQMLIGVISVFGGVFVAIGMVGPMNLPPETLWLLLGAFIAAVATLHAVKGWYGLTIGALIGIALVPMIGFIGLLVICGGMAIR